MQDLGFKRPTCSATKPGSRIIRTAVINDRIITTLLQPPKIRLLSWYSVGTLSSQTYRQPQARSSTHDPRLRQLGNSAASTQTKKIPARRLASATRTDSVTLKDRKPYVLPAASPLIELLEMRQSSASRSAGCAVGRRAMRWQPFVVLASTGPNNNTCGRECCCSCCCIFAFASSCFPSEPLLLTVLCRLSRCSHVHVACVGEASRIHAWRRGGRTFPRCSAPDSHALGSHKRRANARMGSKPMNITKAPHLPRHRKRHSLRMAWSQSHAAKDRGYRGRFIPPLFHAIIPRHITKCRACNAKRKILRKLLAPCTNEIIPGSIPFLGHCWRSALLAAFCLGGFVSTAEQLDAVCWSAAGQL